MATYNGTFTVVNCTNNTISNVSVVHTCGSFTNSATAGSLAPGQAVATSLNSQSGSNDLWSITFTMNGQTYSRSGKQCNYMPDDSPQGVVISLYLKNFSVLLPVTSSCLNNYYSTPSTAKDEALAAAETTGGVKED
ncbi:hypothetical protein [Azorhizobium doebereinerae]|uniref:hypothetical protein n=1 Tax=Azorhizobium doebereinerae TaxID=281091 RepID=UPI000419F84A|nr:hypothetical protein [Azorhizobium doebereinerae]